MNTTYCLQATSLKSDSTRMVFVMNSAVTAGRHQSYANYANMESEFEPEFEQDGGAYF